jgi:hypothetical protein
MPVIKIAHRCTFLRFTLEILRRGPDDNLVDFHRGRLLDGVSDRACN